MTELYTIGTYRDEAHRQIDQNTVRHMPYIVAHPDSGWLLAYAQPTSEGNTVDFHHIDCDDEQEALSVAQVILEASNSPRGNPDVLTFRAQADQEADDMLEDDLPEDMTVAADPVANGYLTFSTPPIDPVENSTTPPPTYQQLGKSMMICNDALHEYAVKAGHKIWQQLGFDTHGNVVAQPASIFKAS
jgi:hypothetical protein